MAWQENGSVCVFDTTDEVQEIATKELLRKIPKSIVGGVRKSRNSAVEAYLQATQRQLGLLGYRFQFKRCTRTIDKKRIIQFQLLYIESTATQVKLPWGIDILDDCEFMLPNATELLLPSTLCVFNSQVTVGNVSSVGSTPTSLVNLKCIVFHNRGGTVNLDANIFSGLPNLEEVIFSNRQQAISHGCFSGLSRLKKVLLPNTLLSMSERAFMKCTSLESIEIPSSVDILPPYAFYGCIRLKEAKLNEGLLVIDELAFTGCESLTTVDVPYTVSGIDKGAFYHNNTLSKLIMSDMLVLKLSDASTGSYMFGHRLTALGQLLPVGLNTLVIKPMPADVFAHWSKVIMYVRKPEGRVGVEFDRTTVLNITELKTYSAKQLQTIIAPKSFADHIDLDDARSGGVKVEFYDG